MNREFEAVMFDLDGTLADTLDALANAGNDTLSKLGRPPIPRNEYRFLVGQGIQSLMTRALGDDGHDLVADGTKLFREYYDEHGNAQTRIYEGVPQLLEALERRQIVRAVFSNKPHPATQMCVATKFADYQFDAVAGAKPDVPLKPDPKAALAIADALNIPPDRWLYLGDTNVDMLTANAAGMYAVGALWGFRDATELRDSGAKSLIDHPMKLLDVLDGGRV